MTKLFNLIAVILVFTLCSIGQTSQTSKGFIAGRITERSTGQPISAEISLGSGASTQTDGNGSFRLEVKGGIYSVKISSPGFAPVIVNQVGVTGGRDTIVNIQLDVTFAENVEIRSEVFAENIDQNVSNITLRREDLRATPGTGGDPLRAINSQPAVSAASGEFADLIVRGGTPDENLTYVDSIPVRDFTYFTDSYDGSRGGRASILPPDVFDRAEFSAGGFGVRYGDKLSSALDVGIRESNRRRVQGVLFADSGTAGASIDIPFGKRGGWLTSGRRSYIDVALDIAGIADQGIIGYPRTLDFTNKFVYDLTPKNKISFTSLNFFESFDQTDSEAERVGRRADRFRMKRTSQRHVFGATLSSTIGQKSLAQTTIWTSVNHNDGSFFLPFSTTLRRSRDLRDSQSGIKEDLIVTISPRTRFSVGGGLVFDRGKYHSFEEAGSAEFFSPLEEERNAPRRENRFLFGVKTSAYAYAQGSFYLTRRFFITPGIRLDRYSLTDETLVSPRFAARFNVTGKVSLTFASGIYRQPPSLFVLSLTTNNLNLKSQSATHIIGGIEWLLNEDIRIRFEGFRKSYRDLIVQPIGPTPTFISNGIYGNTGSGESRGFELSIQKSLTGFFSGQASYGFMRSTRSLSPDGNAFSSDFERPHQLTLIGITSFYGFNVAAKYRAASGLPYTRRTPVSVAPNSGLFIQRIQSANDINALRLPIFASLDVRAEKRFALRRVSVSPYIDIFNITNHDTVVQPDYEFYRRSPQFLYENKRLPIFGFRIEF